MITTTDIANIMYGVCRAFEMPVYQDGNIPKGKPDAEGRVVIHAKEQSYDRTWKKCFVEVNLITPDTRNGHADLIRLNELERMAHKILKGTGRSDGNIYSFKLSSTTVMKRTEMDAHMVNARVLFRVINTME